MVWRRQRNGMVTYLPRRNASHGRASDSEDGPQHIADGYLYISGDLPWPRDRATVIADRRVPESWLEVSDRTRRTSSGPRRASTCRSR